MKEILVHVRFDIKNRKALPQAGYMPHFVVADDCLGVRFLNVTPDKKLNMEANVTVALIYPGVDYSDLNTGVNFRIFEGDAEVGIGHVIK